MVRAFFLLFLLLGLVACAEDPPAPQARSCTLERKADLPLRTARNFMLAPVSLNGRATLFVVDTGAEASMLTPEAAATLKLPRDPQHGSVLLGVAGPLHTPNVRVSRFAIGGVVRTDQSIGLGELPPFPGLRPIVAGLLGADVLSGYDVDIDLPHGRMALYLTHGCAGFKPWPESITVPLERTRSGLVFVDAIVDGSPVRALLDTGARTTLIARRTASVLGISDTVLDAEPRRIGIGIGLSGIDFRQHRFASLGLPGAMEYDKAANIADMKLPGVDMLLGADFLGPRQFWISYSTNRLFLR
jgi:predicted aspartyl protease